MARKPSPTPSSAAPDAPSEAMKSSVQSLAKGLRILEIFAADDEPLTVTEIAERALLDPGTAFRMLNTLVALGYVTRSEKRRYSLSLKVLDLGFNAIGRQDLRSTLRPILRSLVGEKIEAASFGVLEGPNVIYVERVRAGITRLGVDIRIGTAIPAAINILGQAILAYLPPADLEQALSKQSANTGNYPVLSRARLLPQLKTIRDSGFAVDSSMITAGLGVLSVPVLDTEGYPMAAVSVAVPHVICSKDELCEASLARLKAAAFDIAKVMQISGTSRFG